MSYRDFLKDLPQINVLDLPPPYPEFQWEPPRTIHPQELRRKTPTEIIEMVRAGHLDAYWPLLLKDLNLWAEQPMDSEIVLWAYLMEMCPSYLLMRKIVGEFRDRWLWSPDSLGEMSFAMDQSEADRMEKSIQVIARGERLHLDAAWAWRGCSVRIVWEPSTSLVRVWGSPHLVPDRWRDEAEVFWGRLLRAVGERLRGDVLSEYYRLPENRNFPIGEINWLALFASLQPRYRPEGP